MAKELKNLIVRDYRNGFDGIKNFVLVTFHNVGASDSGSLRSKLKENGMAVRVVKNSLVVIAFREMGLSELADKVSGPCAVATNSGECVDLAKILVNCEKDVGSFKINGGFLDGRVATPDDIVALSNVPDRSVVNAQILAGIKSPLVGIAGALNNVLRSMLVCFQEIEKKKQ